jgi:RNA polymerase-binding transcription factor DksA
MAGITTPGRRRPDLLIHLPELRADLEEQRLARTRQLTDLLDQEDQLHPPRMRWTTLVGDETTTQLIDTVRRALGDIELALHRIHVGRYGTCLYCGADLPLAQLRRMPQTEACGDCAGR